MRIVARIALLCGLVALGEACGGASTSPDAETSGPLDQATESKLDLPDGPPDELVDAPDVPDLGPEATPDTGLSDGGETTGDAMVTDDTGPACEEACAACGTTCVAGACVFTACQGRACGPDGCNGVCGQCPAGQGCTNGALALRSLGEAGCEPMPSCGNDFCNLNFGETCASCPRDCPCGCGEACQVDATCVFVACDGRACGTDGCGGSCGECPDHNTCKNGGCVYVPWCGDHACDPNETCASCPADCACTACGEACVEGGPALRSLGEAGCAFVACEGRECGPDGCDSSCGDLGGECPEHHACDEGACLYVPWCGDATCDSNEDCATCPTDCACPACGDVCLEGACVSAPCTGRACGPDGCGGWCGDCPLHHACAQGALGLRSLGEAVCVYEPWCGDATCDPNEDCGTCEADCACTGCGETCEQGAPGLRSLGGAGCAFSACVGRACGPDGCGGSCGGCPEHHDCADGACFYVPWCGDGSCDPTEDCATCEPDCACTACGTTCDGGNCRFHGCDGRECGPDGCGGSCDGLGGCDDDLPCTDDVCAEGQCQAALQPDHCLLEGACVEPGTVDPVSGCAACDPATDPTAWSPLAEQSPCGDEGGVCYLGACCPHAANCAERTCGQDGCGGSCGSCPEHYVCEEGDPGLPGLGEAVCTYVPWCGDGACAPNEDCAGCEADCACTTCGGACVGGACQFVACVGRSCGDDGCGGSCGECAPHHACEDGACIYQPWCGDGTCDADEDCSSCADDCACTACGTTCVTGVCSFSACEGRECGPDGCGGGCGECEAHYACADGTCTYQPWCGDGTCDPDENCGALGRRSLSSAEASAKADGEGGCPADCACAAGQVCLAGGACCTPTSCEASGWRCGEPGDGCGGPLACGECLPPEACGGGGVPFACGTPEPLPYPTRDPMRLKSIQPDFWPRPEEIAGNGAGGVAMNLVWSTWEPTLETPPCAAGHEAFDGHCFAVDAAVDQAIADWTARGLVVTGVVYGVPGWARIEAGCSPVSAGFEIFCAPRDPADFGRFAGYLAWRYNGLTGHGRVADFVIHNEVNSNDWYDVGCGQGVYCEPTAWVQRYAADWSAAYDRIVGQQPFAKVLTSFTHHFDPALDAYGVASPVISVRTFLPWFAAHVGTREWRVAYHPYPTSLTSPTFGPRDFPRVTYGNLGALVGWLMTTFPNDPHAWDVQLTESGINSLYPGSYPAAQVDGVCRSLKAVLGTPFISNYVYHRMQDHPTEVASGLGLGLWDAAGVAKPAWTTWALANRADLDPPQLSCGFEHLPHTRLVVYGCIDTGTRWTSTRPPPANCTERQAWRLLRAEEPGTHLVHECLSGANDSFASLEPGCEGQRAMGPLGWAYDAPQDGAVPLYRCFSGFDHFVWADPGCNGSSQESLLGYALP